MDHREPVSHLIPLSPNWPSYHHNSKFFFFCTTQVTRSLKCKKWVELWKSHYLILVYTASNARQDHRACSGVSEHKGMFNWVYFREDGKKNWWVFGWREETKKKKKMVESRCFLSMPIEIVFSPNLREDWREKKLDKRTLVQLCYCWTLIGFCFLSFLYFW